MSTRTAPAAKVDPVTASIIRHGLDAAADQMLVALKRTAFSPIIYEVMDGAGAFYDRRFRMLSQMTALPMFTGSLGLAVESVVKHYEANEGIQEGDVLVVNDPFVTGTHQWDVAVIVPGFLDGEIVCYAAIKAHHLDVAALAPFVTESTDVFQEGTIWPGVKLWKQGRRDDDLYRMFLANTRLPDSAAGDLNAQAGACHAGLRAVLELIERYGLEKFEAAVETILDAGEATMREKLAEFPRGRFTGTVVHEHNGFEEVMIPYEVAVEFVEDGIVIDLTGAPEPQPGPVNAPVIGVISAIRCAMMALAIQDGGRANEGYFRPLQLKSRPGSMIDAQSPAPVALASYPLYILIEGLNEAIANAMPDARPAGYDMVVTLFMWGKDDGDQVWIDSVNITGGAPAAAPYGDGGAPLMPIACSGVRSVSWEVWEAKTPMIVESCDFAIDSHGVGKHRGGPGWTVLLKALRPMDLTIVNERSRVPPFALAGAEKGRRNEVLIHRPDGSSVEYSKVTATHLPEGSVIEMKLSGGSGVGPAAERAPEKVATDVAEGYLSEERARDKYPHAF
ncbi:MAG: hydantoinase B/oxoprolinase family protein [Solirubrobacterales bacterium]